MNFLNFLKAHAKAIVAVATAVVTALSQNGVVLPSWVGQILPFIGAFLVYLVPNKQ